MWRVIVYLVQMPCQFNRNKWLPSTWILTRITHIGKDLKSSDLNAQKLSRIRLQVITVKNLI